MKKLLFIIVLLFASSALSQERCVQIVLSQNLRPYWETAKGIKESLKEFKSEICLIEDYQPSPCIKVTVGLKATESLKDIKVCSLLLYPDIVEETRSCKCGIFLEIPPKTYLKVVKEITPWVKSVSIIYSDSTIESYANSIELKLTQEGLKVRKIRVLSIEELNKILKKSETDAVIPIPDPIFSTEAVIRLLVNRLVAQGKVVIGYNKYFAEIGSPVSIITDYRETGIKTAKLVFTMMESGKCTWEPAVHKIKLNQEILKKLTRGRNEFK